MREVLTYRHVEQYTRSLYDAVVNTVEDELTAVIAPLGGGLIPAGMFNYLHYKRTGDLLPVIYPAVKGYNGERKLQTLDVHWPIGNMRVNKNQRGVVFLDDIIDSGRTVKYFAERFKHLIRCGLVVKEGSEDVDFFSHVVPEDTWVVFPWESDTSPIREIK